ncbi:hypothetical protein MCG44_08040 [Lawsonibacter sp. OA9]|uniref:hypothetical protein n=1 Tax=Oscillospiraceae TaxID=216572 RepID=UPI001D973FCB|nr:hypothetical protein [Lawsonibacter sp. OA9]MBS5589581.1 hypothetical protein [Clostridiales bacterium]MCH1979701.1 hypothetical protein [Lawsonibacter sp. OA9]
MTNEDKILEILRTLQKDMTEVRKDITELKDGQAEIRSGVNTLLEWADKVGDSIEFPLPKIM